MYVSNYLLLQLLLSRVCDTTAMCAVQISH